MQGFIFFQKTISSILNNCNSLVSLLVILSLIRFGEVIHFTNFSLYQILKADGFVPRHDGYPKEIPEGFVYYQSNNLSIKTINPSPSTHLKD
jgi:hypothetical protein